MASNKQFDDRLREFFGCNAPLDPAEEGLAHAAQAAMERARVGGAAVGDSTSGSAGQHRRALNPLVQEFAALDEETQRNLIRRERRLTARHRRGSHWIIGIAKIAAVLMVGVLLIGTSYAAGQQDWFNQRPIRDFYPDEYLEIELDGKEVWLHARDGTRRHGWATGGKFRSAQVVEQHEELGGQKLALIGFPDDPIHAYGGTLAAFDVHGNLDEPVWSVGLTNADLPVELLEHPDWQYDASEFGVRVFKVVEVFPDSPGEEVVFVLQHQTHADCAVVITDMAGNVKFRAFHDGNLSSMAYMSKHNQLVFCGLNADVPRHHRGGLPAVGRVHTIVLLAIEPESGRTEARWIDTPHRTGGEPTVWYKCLLGPNENVAVSPYAVREAYGRFDPADHVWISFNVVNPIPGAGLSMVLDHEGNEVPKSRNAGNGYKVALGKGYVPAPEVFQWIDLPPILPEYMPDGDVDEANEDGATQD